MRIEVERTNEIEVLKEKYSFTAKCLVRMGEAEDITMTASGYHLKQVSFLIDNEKITQDDYKRMKIDLVGIEEIVHEMEDAIEEIQKQEKIEEQKREKIQRAEAYDKNFLINSVLPLLETEGFDAKVGCTKQEYINGSHEVDLVWNNFTIDHDWNGRLRISDINHLAERTTSATKPASIVKIFKEVVAEVNNKIKYEAEKKKEETSQRKNLENILGVPIEEEKEWHPYSYRHSGPTRGYEVTYFKVKGNDDLKFTIASIKVGEKYVKGFKINGLPAIADPIKLKKLYELIIS